MLNRPQTSWRIVHSEASLGWGGQEHRILAELNGFRARGCHVWLAAHRSSKIYERGAAQNLSVRHLETTKWRYPATILRQCRWLREHRIQIVNTHSSRDGWIMGLAARMAGVPLLMRTRHFDVPIANRWVSRHAYVTLCDHLLTTSPKVSRHLQELFSIPSDRVSTVPTGIDLNRFRPAGPRAELLPHGQPGRNGRLPLIGMIAIMRVAKGHAILLEAARLLKESGFRARYVFVGEGPGWDTLHRLVRELGLEDDVQFTGFREDVPEILRALDLLALPSLHEGIPQVGLQALATGTPVVGSDVGGIPSIVRPGETGRLFQPGDVPGLVEVLREVFAQPEATRRMTEAGRKLVEREHSLEAMLDRLEAIYRKHLPR